jgi:hypothetical protein
LTNTTHPRRALAEAEAAAWLDLHRDWAKGSPAEVATCSVTGRGPAPIELQGNWRDRQAGHCNSNPLPWWRQASSESSRWSEVSAYDGLDDSERVLGLSAAQLAHRAAQGQSQLAPTLERVNGSRRRLSQEQRTPEGYITPASRDAISWSSLSRRQALSEVAKAGQLKQTTPVQGERVSAALGYDSRVDGYRRRAGVLQNFAEVDAADTRWQEGLAVAELQGWLVLHLTAKEVEALEQRAHGEAVADRHTLARAQRKAQEALAAH